MGDHASSILNGEYLPDDYNDEFGGENIPGFQESSAEPLTATNKKHLNLSLACSVERLHGRNRSLAIKSEMNHYSSLTLRKPAQRARSTLNGHGSST